MKRLVLLTTAVLAVTACSEATAPSSDLAPRAAKPSTDPGISVAGSLTNDSFTFDDGTFSSTAGSSFTIESLEGGFGASAPNIAAVYNNNANKFLGRANNHRVVLVVPNGGSEYEISYDLYVIGSWDGNGKQSGKEYGVDLWSSEIACSAAGPAVQTLLQTTFSNQKTVQQSFPASYGGNASGNKAAEGAFATDALGFINDPTSHTPLEKSMGDTWYKLNFKGTNPCGAGNPVYFVWTVPGGSLQSNYDESWGLDNVLVKTDA